MCKGSAPATTTTQQQTGIQSGSTAGTSTFTPNQYVQQAYQDLMSQANGVAQTPFQMYPGQFVAPTNQQQMAGVGGINANANYALPYEEGAAGLFTGASTPLTSEDINKYYSPYNDQVVKKTQDVFNQQNAVQQQGLLSNAASQNALGGSRVGVTQSALAGQQQLAQAPVIAGLENTGYGQAVQWAMAQKQNAMNAGFGLGNVGIAGQNAALQGAGAQYGVGSQQQQMDQAQLNAMYSQYLAQQGYPFQTAQWLAGIYGGLGGGLGGTTQSTGSQTGNNYGTGFGTQTLPPPNPLNTVAGLGLLGGAAYGALNSPTPTPQSGSGSWRGGPVAGFAAGGAPDDGGVIPYSGGVSYVPRTTLAPRQIQVPSVPQMSISMPEMKMPGATAAASSDPSLLQMAGGVGNLASAAKGLGGLGSTVGGWLSPAAETGGDAAGMIGLADTAGAAESGGLFSGLGDAFMEALPTMAAFVKDGGRIQKAGLGTGSMRVNGYAGAGKVVADPEDSNVPSIVADESEDTPNNLLFPGYGTAAAFPRGVPLPQSKPAEMPDVADPDIATPQPGVQARPQQQPMPQPGGQTAAPPARGFGFPALSHDAQLGLMAAGLGMMGSRSPYFGVAAGEGGTAGLQTYLGQQKEHQKFNIQQEALNLRKAIQAQSKTFHEDTLNERRLTREDVHDTRQDALNERKLTREDAQKRFDYQHDPKNIRQEAEAKRMPGMTEEAMRPMVDAYAEGNKSVLSQIARGTSGSANLQQFWEMLSADYRAKGLTGRDLNAKQASFQADTQAAKSLAVRQSGIETAITEAQKTFPLARMASNAIPRGQFVPLNQLEQMVREKTSSVEQGKFYLAVQAVKSAYASAMQRGNVATTVHAMQSADKLFDTATSNADFEGRLKQAELEMEAARESPEAVRDAIMSRISGRPVEKKPAAAEPPAAGKPAAAPKPKEGDRQPTREGTAIFRGGKWVLEGGT